MIDWPPVSLFHKLIEATIEAETKVGFRVIKTLVREGSTIGKWANHKEPPPIKLGTPYKLLKWLEYHRPMKR